MDKKSDVSGIIEAGIGRLKYLMDAGIREVPFPSKKNRLNEIHGEISACERCPLCRQRKNAVFGAGNPDAKVLFVGGVPSKEDDLAGGPFTGSAGEQLTKIIKSMGLERKDVYITNVVKCRPSGDRIPTPEEFSLCVTHLEGEIDVIGPRVIISLGGDSTGALLGCVGGAAEMRGRFHLYRGIKLMPTHPPGLLLEKPELKKDTWHDIQMVIKELKGP